MFPVPSRYNTMCTNRNDGSIIFERAYEAININEASARAYLNCVKEGNKPDDIQVNAVKRRLLQ